MLTVRYEDLVTRQGETLEQVCDHLDLKPGELDVSPPTLDGVVGDPSQARYDSISSASLDKWKTVLSNPLRKQRARAYLDWLGAERLDKMGYVYDDLIQSINAVPVTSEYICGDTLSLVKGFLWSFGEYEIYKEKIRSSGNSLIHHG